MAYTQTDLDNLETAILKIMTGEMEVQVSFADKSIRFAEPDLPQMRELRSMIKKGLGTAHSRVYAGQGGRGS